MQPASGRSWPQSNALVRTILVAAVLATAMGTSLLGERTAVASDLSGAIGRARSVELGLQASMRRLDLRIRHLRHDRRSLRKRIGHAHRTRSRIHEHQDEVHRAMVLAGLRVRSASADLQRAPASTAAGSSVADGPILDGPTTETSAGRAATAIAPDVDPGSPTEEVTATGPSTPDVRDPAASLREAESALRDLEREGRRLTRKEHHLDRALRRLARRAAGVRRQTAAAQRALPGTESALGYQIEVMTRLAKARAAKKTKHGPARQGFVWPTRGQLTQGYGCTGFRYEPRRGSCAHFHDGIDLAGASGTPIRAAATGVIAYVGWNPWDQEGRAYIVVIAHAGGFVTRYGHLLPRSKVTLGRLVRRGDLIGYMGSTGNSTGPHLHLEVLRGGTTVNPLAYL